MMTLSIIQSIVMLTISYVECHIQTLYAECYFAECRYAYCLGALNRDYLIYERTTLNVKISF
jgi:hypothetical protein